MCENTQRFTPEQKIDSIKALTNILDPQKEGLSISQMAWLKDYLKILFPKGLE